MNDMMMNKKRVILDFMDGINCPWPGTCGIVEFVCDNGQMWVNWEDGRSSSLVPGTDKYHFVA